jgi:hypothetical protein
MLYQAPVFVAVMTLMNPIGTMVGFVIPFLFINVDGSSNPSLTVSIKTSYFWFMFFEFAVGVALLVSTGIFMRDHRRPPRLVEEEYMFEQSETRERRVSLSDPLFEITAYPVA